MSSVLSFNVQSLLFETEEVAPFNLFLCVFNNCFRKIDDFRMTEMFLDKYEICNKFCPF